MLHRNLRSSKNYLQVHTHDLGQERLHEIIVTVILLIYFDDWLSTPVYRYRGVERNDLTYEEIARWF